MRSGQSHAKRARRGANERSPLWTLAPLAPLVPLLAAPLLFAPDYDLQRYSKFLIFAILALGLDFLAGRTGLVSLGQAAFFAIGAYGFALLAGSCDAPATLSLWLGLAAAAAIAAAAAAALGALAMRTHGIYFLMVTLAIGQMVFYGLHDIPMFGGSDGIFVCAEVSEAVPRNLPLNSAQGHYLLSLAAFTLAVALFWGLRTSFFGKILEAVETGAPRLAALGFSVFPLKLAAFTIAGATAGLAGALEAMRFRFVNPELSAWHVSGLLLVMVVLGGRNRLWGPVLGAALVIGLEDMLLYWFPERWKIGMGALALGVALFLPDGVADAGRAARASARFLRRRGARSARRKPATRAGTPEKTGSTP